MNPKKNELKWSLAQNKIDRIERILRAKLLELGYTTTDDFKIIEGVVTLLQIKADKDVRGDPNGRMRIIFGETSERQNIPIKDDNTNVDGIANAIIIFVKQKRQSFSLEKKRKQEREEAAVCAQALAQKCGGRFEETPMYIRTKIGKNIDVNFRGEEGDVTIRGLNKSQIVSLVDEINFFGLLVKEDDQ